MLQKKYVAFLIDCQSCFPYYVTHFLQGKGVEQLL